MGLFDGAGAGELASTAQVAKLLRAPVLLVVDAAAASRSVAAVVHGFATFDRDLRVAGVVLNRVGSEGHEGVLRGALAPVGVPVVGVLRRDRGVATPGRHLGLVPAGEREADARRAIARLGELARRACDLEAVLRLAGSSPPLPGGAWDPSPSTGTRGRIRIGLAAAPAFTFSYEENLELLRARGAEIVAFDPTRDESLPDGVDALLLGGGFPEAFADVLSGNGGMRRAVGAFASSGRPVVAECGGLLYLCRSLDGRPMCGVIPAEARMTDRLTLGYREAVAVVDSVLAPAGIRVRGHEFHYSELRPRAGELPAWRMRGSPEGFVRGGVHASYLHLHWAARPALADRLVAEALARREAA
jgi:cobyrinic acid a,c-diamide synthase